MSVQVTQWSAARWEALGGRVRTYVRETYIRDHVAPLLTAKSDGAVKLDLVLRGLAALPGENPSSPGSLPEEVSWNDLHDLVRDTNFYGASEVKLKRKWTSDKLAVLEHRRLIRREPVGGTRPRICVLRDDGSGAPFDVPDGQGNNSYAVVFGRLIEYGWFAQWGGPEVAAFLAAITAERYARTDADMARAFNLEDRTLGGGAWFRSLAWFSSGDRPGHHVKYPFSARTLRRGFATLAKEGVIGKEWIALDPRRGTPFPNGPRVLYWNHFDDLRRGAAHLAPYRGSTDAATRSRFAR